MSAKTAVLMINVGTPDSPSVKDVRRYLFEFLNDPYVIDIPKLLRLILVNLIIVPFRAPKSAKLYQQLWTKEGSPLIVYGRQLQDKLQQELGGDYHVELAMRYRNPSIPDAMKRLEAMDLDHLIVLPLYPQYALSTTQTSQEAVEKELARWTKKPRVTMIDEFCNPELMDCLAGIGKEYEHEQYDHVLFSFHGLPVRHIDKVHERDGLQCDLQACADACTKENPTCYKSTSYQISREVAKRLNIPEEKYTVCFQSRLDKNWLVPFSDKVVEERAKTGDKKLLVFSPAFVADCLETIVEIGDEYDEIFKEHGGEQLQMVRSLNAEPSWVKFLGQLLRRSA